MTAPAREATIPAYPLGKPEDGRERFGMTPEQACLYRWLVRYKPHGKAFTINTRHTATLFLAKSHSRIHDRVVGLVERGWLEREAGSYRFVQPIRHFREPR
jgi:hypothetical protein